MTQNNKLPKDWRIVKLKDIATLSSQKHSPVKPEDLFYIGLEHIEKHTGKLTSKVGLDKITTIKNKFSKGDILYGKLRPNLNKVYLSKEEGVCSTDILVLKLSEGCLGKYLHSIMFSTTFVNEMSDNTSGVNLPRVSTKFIMNYEIPFPPLETQNLIISKIEELFSELDKGIEDLKTAQQQLKTYRQSVLKYAFEGKLTNEKVKNDVLPKGWKVVNIEDIAKVGTGATPLKGNKEFYENGKIAWVTSGALNDEFVRTATDYVTEVALKETNLSIYPKHTLLLAMYGEGKTRGKCSELLIQATTNQAIAAISFENHDIRVKPLLKYFLLKNYNDIRRLSSGGVQPNLNLGIVKKTTFPFPPIEEQHKIVQEIERRLSVADKMEESISQSLLQAEALRQSILKKAFSGELV